MNKVYRWLLAACVVFGVVACDEEGIPNIEDMLSQSDSTEVAAEDLKISDITFSDDYKVMELSTKLLKDIGAYNLSDSASVIASVKQHVTIAGQAVEDDNAPVLVSVKHMGKDEVAKLEAQGIVHAIRGQKDLEEAAGAYKNIDEVMAAETDLVKIVTELSPVAVIKG